MLDNKPPTLWGKGFKIYLFLHESQKGTIAIDFIQQ